MSRLLLRQISRDRSPKDIPVERAIALQAEPGATYQLLDARSRKPASGVTLKRKDHALVVEVDGEAVVEVERFFGHQAGAAFDAGGGGVPVPVITETSTVPEVSGTPIPAGSGASATPAGESANALLGALALGGLGLVASSGSTAAPVNNTVVAKVVGGPVIKGNDLVATIYAADSTTVLGRGVINENGTVTVQVGSYLGVVVVRVQNDQDPANDHADYLDEALGVAKDLGDAVLHSMGEIATQNGVITLNVNILTALAYHEASEVAKGAPLTAPLVRDTNAAVARVFGLESLTEGDIKTTVDKSGNASESNIYGELLAALSGADKNNGGSVKATLEALIDSIAFDGKSATLTEVAVDLVRQGARVVDPDNSAGVLDSVRTSIGKSLAPGDTVAPAANFGAATDDVGSVAGALASGAKTDDTSLSLSGSCEAGSEVEVFNGSIYLGLATVTGTTWAYSATVANGVSYQFNVTETDTAGNTSAATSNFTVIGDTTAPTASFGAATDDVGSVTGSLASGARTDDTSLALSGSCEAGSTVKVYNGTTLLGTATVTGTTWVYTATLANGTTYQLNVTETDTAGNTSAATSNFTVTGDTTAPAANFGAANDDVGSVTGALASGARTDDTSLALSGSCEAGSTVKVYNGTTLLGSATVTGTAWAYNATVANGTTYQFKVTETDTAGNTSAATSNFTVIGDTTAPTANFGAATDDAGSVSGALSSGARTDDTSLALSGSCEAGNTVKVYNGTTLLGSATVTGTAWAYSASVANGTTYQFNVTETDTAGNTSAATSNFTVTGDTTAPTASFGAATDDVGSVTGSLASGARTDDTSLALSGSCEAGSTVKVYNGTTLLGTATVTGTTWAYTATVANGTTYQFNVTETDTAGNTSAATSNFTVIGDTTAPTANFGAATDDVGSATGALASGARTDDTSLALSGSCEAGSTVKVYNGTTLLGPATVTGTAWAYSASVANGTTYQFKVTETDAAGNTSAATSSFTVTGDTTAPTANFGAATDDVGTVTGALSSGARTDDTSLALSGSCEAGSTVKVYNGTTLLGSATVTGTAWAYSVSVANGTTYQFNVTETDTAGNTSAATSNFTVIGDTTAPTANLGAAIDNQGTITGPLSAGAQTDDTSLELSGTCEAGSAVAVYNGVTLFGAATVNGTTWSYTATIVNGTSYQFNVRETDKAGNTSVPTNDFAVTCVTAPTANFGSATDNVGSVTGALTSGDKTDDTNLELSGSCQSGSTVAVFNGTALLGPATVNGTTWAYTATIADGVTYQFNVKETDAANNTSAATSNFTVIGDTTAPTANFGAAADNVGSVTGALASGARTDDTSLALSGSCEVGSTVKVYDGTTLLGAATVTGTAWTYTATVANGTTYQFKVTETDRAGNTSAATNNFTVTGDTTAPTANFGAATDNVGSVTGALSSGARTDDTSLALSGSCETGSTVKVYNGATLLGSATVTGTAWTYTATVANGTTYQFNVTETDAAGNTSAATSNFALTGDTAAPTASVTSASISSTDSAVVQSSEPGTAYLVRDTVAVTNLASITAAADDVWNSVALSAANNVTSLAATGLGAGTYKVYTVDDAGNLSIASSNSITIVAVVPKVELSAIAAETGGFVINGQLADDNSGYSVASAGDVNGDGLTDLIVGAHWADPAGRNTAGKSYVVFGKASSTSINLSDIADQRGGFVINGKLSGDSAGWSVASAGDVNGDGLADLVVGAPNARTGNFGAGKSYVVFGKASTTAINLSDIDDAGRGGFVLSGYGRDDVSGRSVASAGDVNGDGLADLIVGADLADPAGRSSAGLSYVLFGKASPTAINLFNIASANGGFEILGQSAGDQSGWSVASAGDVNGDGLADLIVGGPGGINVAAGKSYVVFGKSSSTPIDLVAVANGSGGFAINGQASNYNSGWSVASAGDVNGDGLADLIVGAPNANPAGKIAAGKSYVVFGKASNTTIDLSNIADGIGGFVINGQSGFDSSGIKVASAGDVNGDGLADLIVGSNQAVPDGKVRAGKSYVVFGKVRGEAVDLAVVAATGSGGFVINGQSASDEAAIVASAGDVNGDGLADLIVGAPYADPASGSDAGKSYVIFGSTTGAFKETAVDELGTTGNDTLSDGGTAKTLVGGAGNDSLTAAAASVLYGGSGNDSFQISAAMITALQTPMGSGGNVNQLARIDGGTGIDTIALSGGGLMLDLTQVANQSASNANGSSRIHSIEAIDLTGIGNNSLKLKVNDVLDMTGFNVFAATGRRQLLVKGDAGDTLDLADGTGTTGWTQAGTQVIDSVTYDAWSHGTSFATVYVAPSISVI